MMRQMKPGQSLTEFAVTLPILLLVLAGVFDLGRGYVIKTSLTNAAREGARALATDSINPAPAIQRTIQESNVVAINPAKVQTEIKVVIDPVTGNKSTLAIVTAQFDLATIFGMIFGLNPLPIVGQAVFPVIR